MKLFDTVKQAAKDILPPTVEQATVKASERRRAMIEAGRRTTECERALEAAYDLATLNEPGKVQEAEAALHAARADGERARQAYASAERRLEAAKVAAMAKGKSDALKARDQALEARARHAARIDELAALIAEEVGLYESLDNALAEAARQGVASRASYIDGETLLRHALEKAGAMESHWIGERQAQPSAAEINAKAEGAIKAVS